VLNSLFPPFTPDGAALPKLFVSAGTPLGAQRNAKQAKRLKNSRD
jgi:hypothetical protein